MYFIVVNAYFDTFVVGNSELFGGWIHVSEAFESKEQAEACLVDYLSPEGMFHWG